MYNQKKESFLNLPTPLEYLPRMSEHLGVELYIKRDDLTNLGMGGNKLRKLEYLVYDAKQKGATMLLTFGGAQTNHGRLTAAVAAKYGMRCCIACLDNYPGEISANLLLDRIMGSDVVLKKREEGKTDEQQYEELTKMLREKYTRQGEVLYEIPIGGSNVVGLLGYCECAEETDRQAKELGIGDALFISPLGSMGTYMGLYCGLQSAGSKLRLKGVAISPFTEVKEGRISEILKQANALYGLAVSTELKDLDIETGYTCGAYNNAVKEVRDAIYLMARKEAIILDPCYTGKAFKGVIDMVNEGKIKKGEKVIFLHTGGAPAINTPHHRAEFERELLDGVMIIE